MRHGTPDVRHGTHDVRFGSKADMNRSNRDVRFTPESGHRLSALGIGSLNRSPRWRRLADYSREDAKSCNAIPAKRFSPPPIRQSDQRGVQSVGLEKDFYGTAFGHAASYVETLKRSQNIPFEGDDLY